MSTLSITVRRTLLIVFLVLFTLTNTWALEEVSLKTVEVNGAIVEYVDQGSGPLLILAHGGLGDYRSWVSVHMPLLAEKYRVISYSMRYYANIEWEESWPQLTLDLYADDLAGLIEILNVGPAHIVGFSLGAEVAHTTALKHPELVRSAYLYEGVANIEKSWSDGQEDKELRSELFDPIIVAHERGDHTMAVRILVDSVGGKVGIFDGLPESAQSFLETKSNALAEYLQRNESVSYTCEEVRNSKVPTTLAVGTASVNYFQTVILKHNSHCLGEKRITNVKDADHLWPNSNAKNFVNLVIEFASIH